MDLGVIVQIVACALATLCSIGAMGIAVWTVHESRRPQPVAFLEHVRDKSSVLFVIENFGTGVASNIEISGFDYAAHPNRGCSWGLNPPVSSRLLAM